MSHLLFLIQIMQDRKLTKMREIEIIKEIKSPKRMIMTLARVDFILCSHLKWKKWVEAMERKFNRKLHYLMF